MEKGKGEVGRRETGKEESMPYRSRLISLQLDEHMFRGPGEFAENSLIRLFDIRRASPKPRPSAKKSANDVSTTIGQVSMGAGGFPQVHPRSFFDLTAFAYGRRYTTMDEAVRAGELTRGVTMPSIATALSPYAFGVVGSASLYVGPTVTASGAAARLCAWKWIAAAGAAAGTERGLWALEKINKWSTGQDGRPGGWYGLKHLVKEYIDENTPAAPPHVQPELWSYPRREKTTILLPPSPEGVESIKRAFEDYKSRNSQN